MNNKKILLSLFSFLLLVLLTNITNAQEDFTVSSSRSVELCPCSNQAYTVTVQNTGPVQSSYAVLASGDAAEWVTFNPDKFVLNPGQKGAFSVIVNSLCNIDGNRNLEIFITTNSRLTKVVKQVLSFSQCYDYSLEQGEVVEGIEESISFLQHDGPYSLCRDEQKSLTFLISNNENFGNQYRLLLDAPSWAELNVNSVSLGAKKSGIFLINFDTTDIEDEYDFKLNAISELGKVQRKKNIEVNVEECYALEVELEKEKDVICGGEEKEYDIIIENSGTLNQDVELELDAPKWADLGNVSFFDLESEEKKTATLRVNPEDDVSGSFSVKIFAVVEDGEELRFSDEIEFDVISKEACFKADISTKTSVTNLYSEDLFFVKVRNNGVKKAAYEVSLEGPSWVGVSPDNLELNPGQTGNLNLNVNPTEDIEPGTYSIEISLESNDVVYSKNVDITLKKENEFVKVLKANVKLYRYYIYLLILIIVLIVIFRKSIVKAKNKTIKNYEKYKVKRERLRALKLVRKERKEEEKKEKELKEQELKKREEERKEEEKKEEELKEQELKKREEERKEEEERKKKGLEEESKKKLKEKREKRVKKFKVSLNRAWIYVLLIIFAAIFIGHQSRLFNAKYLHIYIRNFFYGYLYYISMGIGIVVALFLLVLFYNYINKKRKVKRETKQAEKKTRIKRNQFIPYHRILFLFLVGILIYSIGFFSLFENIKDFFILYQYYIIIGIVILVLIILLIRFYKPLFKLLRE